MTTLEECKNFSDVLYYQRKVNPSKVFIYDLRSKREYTFQKFNAIVEKTANYLLSEGVKPGDRVTAVIGNSPEYCFLYFATLRAGAIFNPMPFSSHKEEIRKYISYIEPSIILIDSRRINEFADERGNFIPVPVDNDSAFEKGLSGVSETPDIHRELYEDEPACIYYSSGTTGNPKGVLFSHQNMISNISSICRGFRFSSNEIHLLFLPLGHTASINYSLLPCMYSGGKIILAESFWHIRNKIWQIIHDFDVTYMEVVPTILYSILNIYNDTMGYDISSLPFVGCGSAPLQRSIQEEFEKRYHLPVANLYGLSETGPTHIDYPLERNWRRGSIGVPLDVNEVKIFDKADKELGPNQVGEIVIKGENVFVGYYKNDNLYKEVVRNGYFHTGDLGFRDEDGYFYFVDREKDLIIKGGVNITPGEIDEVLMSHYAVREATTIGIPDEMFGEEIKSYVVLKDNIALGSDELTEYCRKFLPSVKVPKEIEIIDDVPKTPSGKILRRSLKREQKMIKATDNHIELKTALKAAKSAGEILKENFGKKNRVIRKSPKEMVSEVDMKSQEIITKILRDEFPNYGIITEEKKLLEIKEERVLWIIDPIDGTHNFIAGLPFSGVSIALLEDNLFKIGVIYFPMEDELYHAVRDDGAFCNELPISVSANDDLSKSIINYDNQFYLSKRSFDNYKILTEHAFTTRIFGTATKDLCLTASGKIDGRIWNNTKICDIAAGIVILTEAGGKITNFDGSPCTINSNQVVASNGKVHDQLLSILKEE